MEEPSCSTDIDQPASTNQRCFALRRHDRLDVPALQRLAR